MTLKFLVNAPATIALAFVLFSHNPSLAVPTTYAFSGPTFGGFVTIDPTGSGLFKDIDDFAITHIPSGFDFTDDDLVSASTFFDEVSGPPTLGFLSITDTFGTSTGLVASLDIARIEIGRPVFFDGDLGADSGFITSVTIAPAVPEPGPLSLLGFVVASFAVMRRRQRRQKA